MRVKTKYGEGILLSVDENNGILSYNVLLDLINNNEFKELLKSAKDRIYNCTSIIIVSDLGNEFLIKDNKINENNISKF